MPWVLRQNALEMNPGVGSPQELRASAAASVAESAHIDLIVFAPVGSGALLSVTRSS
jgi:hypothetical protein